MRAVASVFISHFIPFLHFSGIVHTHHGCKALPWSGKAMSQQFWIDSIHNVIPLYGIRLKPSERAGGLAGSASHFGDCRSRSEHRCFYGASLTASISPSGWVASWKGHPWIPCDEQGISRSQWSSHSVPWHARTGYSRYTAYCRVYSNESSIFSHFHHIHLDLMDCIIQASSSQQPVNTYVPMWCLGKLWTR